MQRPFRVLSRVLWGTLALAGLGSRALAASFPERPITLVVPFGAGSSTDGVARQLALELGQQTGASVIVVDRPGAEGIIANQFVKAAAPDGYTLLIATSSSQVINAALYKNLSYDPVKDFEPVAGLLTAPIAFFAKAASPLNTISDVIALARREPGKVTFASYTGTHRLAGEMLNQIAGLKMVDVQYRTPTAALTDLVAGRVDLALTDKVTAGPFSDRVKPLAVIVAKRVASMPNVPTVAESGVNGYGVTTFYAVWAPAHTPQQTIARLNQLVVDAMQSPGMRKLLTTISGEPFNLSPAALKTFQISEIKKMAAVVQAAGIEQQ